MWSIPSRWRVGKAYHLILRCLRDSDGASGPQLRSASLLFPRFPLWYRLDQKLIDSLHQLQLCFRVFVFAMLNHILDLFPEQLDVRGTKLCHDCDLLSGTAGLAQRTCHRMENPNRDLTRPELTRDSKSAQRRKRLLYPIAWRNVWETGVSPIPRSAS